MSTFLLDLCTRDEFYCPSGKCLPWKSTCNALWDCVDGSDEPNVCKPSTTGLTGTQQNSNFILEFISAGTERDNISI